MALQQLEKELQKLVHPMIVFKNFLCISNKIISQISYTIASGNCQNCQLGILSPFIEFLSKRIYSSKRVKNYFHKIINIDVNIFLFECLFKKPHNNRSLIIHQSANTCLFKVNNGTLEEVWNMFIVNNKNTKTTSITSFGCFYC